MQRNVSFGSGDYEDPPEIREEQHGKYFYIKYSNPASPELFNSESGAFESIDQAIEHVKTICTAVLWD